MPGSTTDDWTKNRDEGLRLFDQNELERAAELLSAAAEHDTTGESSAHAGLASYRLERYGAAAEHYERALGHDPNPAEWKQMLAACRANDQAGVTESVPELHLFSGDELLGPLPTPPLPPPPAERAPALWRRVRYLAGHVVGTVGGSTLSFLTKVIGRNYRGEVWTKWYHRNLYLGILTLAYMREKLNRENLLSTYPRGAKVGFVPDDQVPPPGVTHFRTADGTWNNLDDPKEGAAGTRFPRNVHNDQIRPAGDIELLTPNPRRVSVELLTRNGPMKEVPFLNVLAASWIQFQNHDWISHGDNIVTRVIEVPLDDDDPARRRYRQRAMFVARTQPDPTRRQAGEETPVTFINEVTHWWDGSQIYGSDQATQDRLRARTGGKLRIGDDGRLPLGRGGIEDSGMVRNWWVGLAMLHTLFAREHNAICDLLASRYPDWDDNRLFNVARLVNAAVMAKIHSIEWTPAILPNAGLAIGLNSNWYGLLTYRFRSPGERRTKAQFNVRNSELGGIVGNRINKHGSPFGLTEEFVEVYRLHSLLPESLRLRSYQTGADLEEIAFPATRQAASPSLTERIGMANLFYSFGNQLPGQLVLNNFPRFMQELSVPGNPVLDLGAVDILRARERGVPRYNEFRRQLGLNPIRRFEDLTDDGDVRARLRRVYGDDVEQLDLLIGTLAEDPATRRPSAFGFGETLFQIFILNASRRLQADRFYTDDYREEVYTPEGMAWVDRASLKTVILRHYPELESTGLGNIHNAFEPWDTDAELDPERHPLRAFDKDLRPNRWRGDAHR